MKYMNAFALVDGSQEEYRRRHDEIWPEMLELIRKAGLSNYSIWSIDTQLIEYFECDDLAGAARIIQSSPVKARWDDYMRDILVFNSQGEMTPLTCMFNIED